MTKSVLVVALISALTSVQANEPRSEPKPRNMILMIGDGMGFHHVSALRQFADNPATPQLEPTAFDELLIGSLATRPVGADGAVTDSAAGATAYACGIKTTNGAIGVDTEGRPCQTLLELAKQRGKRTGLVVTSQLTHATPAAFYAHVASRKQVSDIASQFVALPAHLKPDLALGGGTIDFSAEQRVQLQRDGLQLIGTAKELQQAKRLPLFGTFADIGLPMAIDRQDDSPSLAEMTRKALSLLPNKNGFVLMIEGSQIDWASHANDTVGMLSEMVAFNEAIAVVKAFVDKHPDTLLVITADHETGGLSLGRDNQKLWQVDTLRQTRASAAGMAARVLAGADAVAVLHELSPFRVTPGQQTLLQQSPRETEALEEAFAIVIAQQSLTGWTTTSHTGADVPLYAFGLGSAALRGHHDNHWLGQQLLRYLSTDSTAPHTPSSALTPTSATTKEQAP